RHDRRARTRRRVHAHALWPLRREFHWSRSFPGCARRRVAQSTQKCKQPFGKFSSCGFSELACTTRIHRTLVGVAGKLPSIKDAIRGQANYVLVLSYFSKVTTFPSCSNQQEIANNNLEQA